MHRVFMAMFVGSLLNLAYSFVDYPTPKSEPDSESGNSAEWLIVDREACILGSVLAESEVDAAVRVTNNTLSQLRIIKLSPACGCLSVTARKMKLDSNESTFIDCRLRAKSRSGRMGTGFVVELENESAERSVQNLLLTAEVSPAGGIACFPEVINFGTVRGRDSVKRVAELTIVTEVNVDVNDLEIVESPLGVESSLQFIGHDGTLVAVLDPTHSASFGAGKIKIRNRNDPTVFVEIPLSWKLKTSIKAVPSSVILAPADSELSGSVEVRFECENGDQFTVRDARVHEKSKDSGISVTATVNNNRSVVARWENQSPSTRDYTGTLEIYINRSKDDTRINEAVHVPIVIKTDRYTDTAGK